MPSWLSKVLAALKLLVRNPLYLILALVLAKVLFAVYFIVNDLALYRSAFSISSSLPFLWKVFSHHVSIIADVSGLASVLAVGVVSILGGINLSLTVLRVRRTGVFVGRAALPGFLGILGGAFAASCSACSTALISVLGLSGGLAILPLQGLEISLLAIGILSVALYFTSKSLVEFGLTGGR